jgi:FtsP/CotA-like multicopper oxidase with cupredoxin domain
MGPFAVRLPVGGFDADQTQTVGRRRAFGRRPADAAQILVPLTQMASEQHPFMFHCHILEHEDAGMMGQYTCT